MERIYQISEFHYPTLLGDVSSGKVYSSKFDGSNLTLYINDDATQAELDEINTAVANHDTSHLSPYRITSYINEEFLSHHIENIDFVRHARADIAFNKVVTKGIDGRPIKAEYFADNGDIVAEIIFDFVTTQDNILVSRKEWLYYYKENGQKSDSILLKKKIFDPISNPTDAELVVSERVKSREAIVSGINGFLSGVLAQALQITIPEVIVTIQPFWQQYEKERLLFIDFGLPNWGNALQIINLATTTHTWLGIVVDANGTTVRDYIVSRVVY